MLLRINQFFGLLNNMISLFKSIFLKRDPNLHIGYLSNGEVYKHLDALKIIYNGIDNKIYLQFAFNKNVTSHKNSEKLMTGPIVINNIEFGKSRYDLQIEVMNPEMRYPRLRVTTKKY